ncbi:MAG: DUF3810 domain-containing protein [Firmicutes bacterium]|nr:DUF3810 domain-containing protein [Bacillota bacterium]
MKMEKNYHTLKLCLLLLLPAGIILSHKAQSSPAWVEKNYTQGFFVTVNQFLSRATGLLPFSVAEILVIVLGVALAISICRLVIRIIKWQAKRKQLLVNFLLNTLIIISILYFSFNLLWGLNYYRQPFAALAGLEIKPAAVAELEELCRSLIIQANSLRTKLEEDPLGVMQLRAGRENVFNTAEIGYTRAAKFYPQLGGTYGQPKGVQFSKFMSYTGITGIYFPFTGEANVNISIPDCMLPATTCHEMAHQRGFAREDEANYLAYLTCMLHPDPDFQYSGTLLALINAINALYRHAPERALLLQEEYSEGLQRDLLHRRKFWQQYEGPLEEISREINDSYLKANRQADGVQSYGRMVDLLLAAYKENQKGAIP